MSKKPTLKEPKIFAKAFSISNIKMNNIHYNSDERN